MESGKAKETRKWRVERVLFAHSEVAAGQVEGAGAAQSQPSAASTSQSGIIWSRFAAAAPLLLLLLLLLVLVVAELTVFPSDSNPCEFSFLGAKKTKTKTGTVNDTGRGQDEDAALAGPARHMWRVPPTSA